MDATCAVDGCVKITKRGRKWCGMHYARLRRTGELGDAAPRYAKPTDTLCARLERFGWDVTPSGCWEWRGSRRPTGYGSIGIGRQRVDYAHRVAYTVYVGPIPAGAFVCHRCDNPPCCNPAHLFLGTVAENNRDMRIKRRHAHGQTNGHARLTPADVAAIRVARAEGSASRELAERYGVTSRCIDSIVAGRTWNPLRLDREALAKQALDDVATRLGLDLPAALPPGG